MGWRMSKLWLKYVEILIEILFATLLALSIINLYQPDEPTIQMTTVVKPSKGNLFQSPRPPYPNQAMGAKVGIHTWSSLPSWAIQWALSWANISPKHMCVLLMHDCIVLVWQKSESFRRFANWRWIPNMVISINVHRKSPWKAVSFNKKSEQGHMEEEDPFGMHILDSMLSFGDVDPSECSHVILKGLSLCELILLLRPWWVASEPETSCSRVGACTYSLKAPGGQYMFEYLWVTWWFILFAWSCFSFCFLVFFTW